jgi:Kef-type K+ transport system membrane component KefB
MTIIISLCLLLLIAYLFDLTAARTKIPSVILLLLLGWMVREQPFDINLPELLYQYWVRLDLFLSY